MKLTRIVKIRLIKYKSRKFCWALISATLIKCSVNFRAFSFQYFNLNFGTCLDILDT